MKESKKAMNRRLGSVHKDFWNSVFKGKGIDVGAGDDPISIAEVVPFDVQDGDANNLHHYFPAEHFDFLHASQCLEHMHDPKLALDSWMKVVKKGGFAVITVPSWELYEGMIWKSRFNPDHKSTWSLWQKGSPAPHHAFLPEWLHKNFPDLHVMMCHLIDTNYSYSIGTSIDQTYTFENSVEAFIEFVLLK